jgi:hypothetical protein
MAAKLIDVSSPIATTVDVLSTPDVFRSLLTE